MSHPLDGATLRVERADRHIGEAQELVTGFARACDLLVVVELRPETGEYAPVGFKTELLPEIPLVLPLALSDAVHNLRSALDYLVHELVRKDSPGVTPEQTQFVIADKKADFDSQTARRLRGLSPVHLRDIERLQPYMGTEWTRTLRDISNPDKHRQLRVIERLTVGHEVILYPPGHAPRPGIRLPSGQTLQVVSNDIVLIPLSSGKVPVVKMLRRLELEVTVTLAAFKPEFEPLPHHAVSVPVACKVPHRQADIVRVAPDHATFRRYTERWSGQMNATQGALYLSRHTICASVENGRTDRDHQQPARRGGPRGEHPVTPAAGARRHR
jgi:hypothetical protein